MSTEMVPIDREGDFRAEIVEYGLQKKDSGSVGVRLKVQLVDMWNGETKEWEDWRSFNVEAWGTQWIVKKDGGGVHKAGVESLIKNCGWDGNLASIVNNTWVPTPCRVSIKAEEYNGNTEYRVNFINAWDSVPGANVGNVDLDSLKSLEAAYGASLRAVAGNLKRNTAPPAAVNGKGGPKAPPRTAAPVAETVPPAANEVDEIPF